MEQARSRGRTAGQSQGSITALSRDDLLKIFSYLDPLSWAFCSMVCKLWNNLLRMSSLWQKAVLQSEMRLTSLSGKNIGSKLEVSENEQEVRADWRARFVKEQHRALFVHGSVFVQDWKGHSGRVECCRMGLGTIVTGSSDRTVRVWSATTLQCLETYASPSNSAVMDVEFDENKIIGVAGRELCVWSRREGSLLRRMGGHNQYVHSLCYADPEACVGCDDGTIRIFDLYSGRCNRIFRQHFGHVTCISMDVDSTILASGSTDGTLRLCDAVSGQRINCLLPSSPPIGVTCLHMDFNGHTLFGGTTGGKVYKWDLRTYKQLWDIRIGPNSVTSMNAPVYEPSTLVVGGINGVVHILDGKSSGILAAYVRGQSLGNNVLVTHFIKKHKLTVSSRRGAHVQSSLENIPRRNRPPILSVRMGMTKIVTTHADATIGVWHFNL